MILLDECIVDEFTIKMHRNFTERMHCKWFYDKNALEMILL